MMQVELMQHQKDCLETLKDRKRCAIYHDMGLGKTFTGSEKMIQLGAGINLVICQKSKIQDWIEHFEQYYSEFPYCTEVYDLPKKKDFAAFMKVGTEYSDLMEMTDDLTGETYLTDNPDPCQYIGVINYELAFRRPDLLKLKDFTLMLDESSLICNEQAHRTKFVLKLNPLNVILLSGTPTSGKYEKLWSQCRLLGWDIDKKVFWNSYIQTEWVDFGGGFMQQVVVGYKKVDHLKRKLAEHGAVFLKTEEVIDLPHQIDQNIFLKSTREYQRFRKDGYLELKDGMELIGDNTLTKILYSRQLCGQYHQGKLDAFRDLLNSTEDSFVVFYNFTAELDALVKIAQEEGRTPGIVNGQHKDNPEGHDILMVQFQAGSYGLNLQGFSNKIIYFTLPLGKGSCDMWEQSKKRIHRIGQEKTCFYYYLLVRNSIEIWNLEALKEGKDFTDALFERMDRT